MGYRLLLSSGPSGGHLFPALAFAQAFRRKNPDCRIVLIVTPRAKAYLASWEKVDWLTLFYLPDLPAAQLFSLKFPIFLLKSVQSFFKTQKILIEVNPDAIISFGTLMSLFVVFSGFLRKIPVILHEQNVAFGKANGLLVRFADRVAVSFPPTLEMLPAGKGILTGNILREEILRRPPIAHAREKKWRILVLGGSQGARVLNRIIFDVFRRLSREEKTKIAVEHLTGVQDYPELSEMYRVIDIESQVYPFSEDMPALFSRSDLVISRAGAGTIAEILYFGLPGILIPYPYAKSHQFENAKYVADAGAAVLLEQNGLTSDRLKEVLFGLLGSLEKMSELGKNAKRLTRPDAGNELVRAVVQLIATKRRIA